MEFTIVDLLPEQSGYIEQVAAMLVEAFREHWPESWPTIEEARQEVNESFEPERISRIALAKDGKTVLGWVGGQPTYALVWELHPLVVRPDLQKQGVGRALVADLEEQVRQRGGLTLTLGSDDEDDMTSLSGVGLYDNLWQRVATIQNFKEHPYEFYQKLGYTITGVVPDANGPGKPDILLSKRL